MIYLKAFLFFYEPKKLVVFVFLGEWQEHYNVSVLFRIASLGLEGCLLSCATIVKGEVSA
jgi:hypothetical protein